jgi:hypothetical protein
VPLLLEYAFQQPTRGPYVLGGLGLFSHYTVTGGGASVTFVNDVLEAKLGGGYRYPVIESRSRASVAFDVNVTADIGQFREVDVNLPGRGRVEGAKILDRDWHATVFMNVGLVWML